MTTVTIVGAGNMARGLATRLLAGKADVQILAPTLEHATSLAAELSGGGGSATGAGMQQPLAGQVVVLATPYQAALDVAATRADELTDKVVVDITNPVDWDSFDRLVTPPESSAAEEIAKRLPGSRVVKAFNTTFATTLRTGEVAGDGAGGEGPRRHHDAAAPGGVARHDRLQQLDVLLAGDHDEAKAQLAEMIEASGMRAVDAGPLRRARQLEHLGFLHMTLQDKLGSGYGSAIKVITP
jgi:predicted dinucleotide-binding enzyme